MALGDFDGLKVSGIKYVPTCVAECPAEIETPIDCVLNNEITNDDCQFELLKDGKGHVGYGTKPILGKFCFPNPKKLPEWIDMNNIVHTFGVDDIEEYVENIKSPIKVYYIAIGTCILTSFVYVILIRCCAKPIVWLSIIGVLAGLITITYTLRNYHHATYVENYRPDDTIGKAMQLFIYVLYVLNVVYIITIMCIYRSINISIAVFQVSAVIILRNTRICIVPLINMVFVVAYLSGWLYGFCYLFSCGTIYLPTDGS